MSGSSAAQSLRIEETDRLCASGHEIRITGVGFVIPKLNRVWFDHSVVLHVTQISTSYDDLFAALLQFTLCPQ